MWGSQVIQQTRHFIHRAARDGNIQNLTGTPVCFLKGDVTEIGAHGVLQLPHIH